MLRALRLGLAAALLIAGCAPRGVVTLMPGAETLAPARNVYVATTRVEDGAGSAAAGFGVLRSGQTAFARYSVTVPPDRLAGQIAWPGRKPPDPRLHFLTSGEERFADAAAFRAGLAGALADRPRGGREAVIFVHGFNTTFAEGLYRTAQVGADLDLPGVLVHYAWPSRANPLAYAYDRDSALFARDGLQRLLRETAAAGAERVLIVAHSMGAGLAMEAMRELAIAGDTRTLDRIGGVMLISPDLDIDLFRAQAARIGDLPQPFVIFTSRRDRALALSARLTGEASRLGNLTDAAPLADLEVMLLDVSAYSSGIGHFVPATSPALLRLMARVTDLDTALALERAGRTGLLPGAVLTVRNATQVILSPVAAIGGAPP